jgi:hypothetical protein
MTTCESEGCADTATHTVNIFFPEGNQETWQVCRTHDRELKLQVMYNHPKVARPSPTPTDTSSSIEVCCGSCQQVLDERIPLVEEERQPCPHCGSLTRLQKVSIAETTVAHESLRLRIGRPGKGGWIRDYQSGEDYSRYLEGWGELVRDKDRKQNVYREVLRLPNGICLESKARLTDHRD